ncbi:Ras-related protein Rab-22A [Tritrichomonas foetus]|uniref:Ras-related protein Rab-22A n=1 Tax=Tritrichomonas foetus TaxID=1144522 RepID=A0A1J4J1A9_9EUKA|nr:Ras-related protein Rab-22A [Tritrichomonas foetus]|eukprot:OHS93328.1 Ras-related protein Rab-22A [Tritrichomonas foetus]
MSEMKNKIVMLGDSGVGKTSLVTRWIRNSYRPDQAPTIGAAYQQNTVEIRGEQHKIQVWDTAGEEKYRAMAPIYSQGAFGALVVFDLTRKQSMHNVVDWIKCLELNGDIPVVVAGNKSDLDSEREVTMEEAIQFVNDIGYTYFETSANNGSGVDEAFIELISQAIDHAGKETNIPETVNFENPASSEKSGCC